MKPIAIRCPTSQQTTPSVERRILDRDSRYAARNRLEAFGATTGGDGPAPFWSRACGRRVLPKFDCSLDDEG